MTPRANWWNYFQAAIFGSRRMFRNSARSSGRLRFDPLEDRTVPATQLLPDLHVLSSYLPGWSLDTQTNPGHTLLRFATAMANGGPGAFEIRGTNNIITAPNGSQEQVVNQRIYNSDHTFTDRTAGTFIYHPTHGHIHFEDFAQAFLRVRGVGNTVGASVATGLKTSFCLIDINRYDSSAPNSPAQPVYQSCGSIMQGISPGWNDVYSSGLDGQFIDITGVPDGNYWLEVVADPANHILESNESNNVTRIPITLNGNQVPSHFRITGSTPLGATDGPIDHIDLTFNSTVNPTTFTTADVKMSGPNGAIAVSSVTRITSTQFRIGFPSQGKVGTYTVNIGPNIKTSSGKPLDQNNNGTGGELADVYDHIFAIEPPHVYEVTPTGNVAGPLTQIIVEYHTGMNPATFTKNQVVEFTGPQGGIPVTSVSPVAGTGNTQFRITFPAQNAAGVYSFTLAATITDMSGNRVDQNGNAIGGETPGDQYHGSFTLNQAGADTFGYVATAKALSGTSILGTGTTLIGVGDDSFASVNVGSNTFNFYGVTYSTNQIFASTNGLISFGAGFDSYSNNDLSADTPPLIAALWDDWTVGPTPPMLLSQLIDDNNDSTADRLILEWHAIQHVPTSPSPITFQAILQLNTGDVPGAITLNYLNLNSGDSAENGLTATVGIKAGGIQGDRRLLISQDQASTYVGTGKSIVIDSPPRVASISVDGPISTNGTSATFDIVFNRPVTGVDVSDFQIAQQGITGSTITSITGTGNHYRVAISIGTGDGHLRLNLLDNDSIVDSRGSVLGGVGLANGTFIGAIPLNVDRTPPHITAVQSLSGLATNAHSVRFQVAISEEVTGVDATDFSVTAPGLTGVSIASVTGSGALYTVTVNIGGGTGSVRLNVLDNDSILDGASNVLGGPGSNGQYLNGPSVNVDPSLPDDFGPVLTANNGNNLGKASVVLRWNTIAGGVYSIRRSTRLTGFSPVVVASGLTTGTFVDTSAVFGVTYYYTVITKTGVTTLVSNQAVITPVFRVFVNFTPSSGSIVPGYVRDLGNSFGSRFNGLSFGWSSFRGNGAVNRNSSASPSELYDTYIKNEIGTWQMTVPNGRYKVRVLAGDPLGTVSQISWHIEGKSDVSGATSPTRRWVDQTVVVNVTDGRLTLTPATGKIGNKVNAVEIELIAKGQSATAQSDSAQATIKLGSPLKLITLDLDSVLTGKAQRYFLQLDPVSKTLRLLNTERRSFPVATRSLASLPFTLSSGRLIVVTVQSIGASISVKLMEYGTTHSKTYFFSKSALS